MLLMYNNLSLQGKLFEIGNYLNNLVGKTTSIDYENGYSLKVSIEYSTVYITKDNFMIFYRKNNGEYSFFNKDFRLIYTCQLVDFSYRCISYKHSDEVVIPELITGLYKIIKDK